MEDEDVIKNAEIIPDKEHKVVGEWFTRWVYFDCPDNKRKLCKKHQRDSYMRVISVDSLTLVTYRQEYKKVKNEEVAVEGTKKEIDRRTVYNVFIYWWYKEEWHYTDCTRCKSYTDNEWRDTCKKNEYLPGNGLACDGKLDEDNDPKADERITTQGVWAQDKTHKRVDKAWKDQIIKDEKEEWAKKDKGKD